MKTLSVFLLFLFAASPAWCETPDAALENFKTLGERIIDLDKRGNEGISEEMFYLESRKIRDALKKLAAENPQSVWADDAQYLVSMLMPDVERASIERETLVRLYPESKLEAWTMENLNFMLPRITPLDLAMRIQLCLDYLSLAKMDELKNMARESARKYPQNMDDFQNFLQEMPDLTKKKDAS